MLSLVDSEAVLGLDAHLSRDVFAAECFVQGQPCGGVLIPLGAFGCTVSCHEVQEVVAEFLALVGAELLGPFCQASESGTMWSICTAELVSWPRTNSMVVPAYLCASVPVDTTQ